MPPNLRDIVNAVVQNNAYFGHPGNVLLTMLFDDRKPVRERAIKQILYYRDELYDPTVLKTYKKHCINFECSDYVDLINLDDDSILSEPPFTAKIPYEHMLCYLEFEDSPLPDPQIPSHIQGTQRFVQLLAGVSVSVIEKNRVDVMAVAVKSRTKIPRIGSKQDLKF